MNPISNLVGKKFKELNSSELMQVVLSYCDQNRYEYNYNFEYTTREDVENYFTSNFHQLSVLKEFFKYWVE